MVARRALDYNSPRILRALLYLIMTLQAARPSVRLVVAAVILYCAAAHADTHCHIVAPHDPTPAEKALLGGQAGEAETLYRDALSKTPHDPALVVGLVHSLLRQQKVTDAESSVDAELATAPDSVPLLTVLGEVQYREGKIAEAAGTADKAYVADRCNARVYLLRSRILRLNSMYSSESRALAIAHQLSPSDPEINSAWSRTIPISQHIEEQKKILAATDAKDEAHDRAEKNIAFLEMQEKGGDKNCSVTSNVSTAEIPVVAIMSDEKEVCDSHGRCGTMPKHIQAWGLHVFLNNREASLQVDTGASGLVISRAVAEQSGLKAAARTQLYGIGDEGAQGGFIAQVDAIKIGALEFHNCMVTVTDRKEVLGIDGVIGTDVFSNYLITLDYPINKMFLAPLPQRPNDNASPATLNTDSGDQGGSSTKNASSPQDRYIDPSMKGYVPFFRVGHDIVIPVALNHKVEHLFLVDTGNFSSSISPEAAREVTKVKGGEPVTIKGLSGNVAKVSSGDVVLFQFAGIQQQNNNLISYDTSRLTRYAGFEISGFLGTTILNELTINIDYRDGMIKFDYDIYHGRHNY
jgi:tetratricopeptide (TPR) repeat protein